MVSVEDMVAKEDVEASRVGRRVSSCCFVVAIIVPYVWKEMPHPLFSGFFSRQLRGVRPSFFF